MRVIGIDDWIEDDMADRRKLFVKWKAMEPHSTLRGAPPILLLQDSLAVDSNIYDIANIPETTNTTSTSTLDDTWSGQFDISANAESLYVNEDQIAPLAFQHVNETYAPTMCMLRDQPQDRQLTTSANELNSISLGFDQDTPCEGAPSYQRLPETDHIFSMVKCEHQDNNSNQQDVIDYEPVSPLPEVYPESTPIPNDLAIDWHNSSTFDTLEELHSAAEIAVYNKPYITGLCMDDTLTVFNSSKEPANSAAEFVPPPANVIRSSQGVANKGPRVFDGSCWRHQDSEKVGDLTNPASNQASQQTLLLPPLVELKAEANSTSPALSQTTSLKSADGTQHSSGIGAGERPLDNEGIGKSERGTRSVSGCLICKMRKVKCDEQRPVCAKCQRSGRECEFPRCASCSTQGALFKKNALLFCQSCARARTHSISGCLICKMRRVKCDEQRPVCANCQRSGRECKFPQCSSCSLQGPLFKKNALLFCQSC